MAAIRSGSSVTWWPWQAPYQLDSPLIDIPTRSAHVAPVPAWSVRTLMPAPGPSAHRGCGGSVTIPEPEAPMVDDRG
jgi:hypothetical protein